MELQPMNADAARRWLDESLATYIQELVGSGGLGRDQAGERATDQLAAILPDRADSDGHRFCWMVEEGDRTGRIWFGPALHDPGMLYVFDLVVDEQQRGRGLGGAALDEVLAHAREGGYASVGLSVFDDNRAARRLYEGRGFRAVHSIDGQTELRLDLP